MRQINRKCRNSSQTCVRGHKRPRPETRRQLRLTCHQRARGAESGVSKGKRAGHGRAGKGQPAVGEFLLGHQKQRDTAGRPQRLRCPSVPTLSCAAPPADAPSAEGVSHLGSAAGGGRRRVPRPARPPARAPRGSATDLTRPDQALYLLAKLRNIASLVRK